MENQNKISKTFLFITVLSFVLFFGSYLTKLNLLSQFFDAETMTLKSIYEGSDLSLVMKSLLPSFSVSMISFIAFVLFFIVYVIVTKITLREEGWLFITIIILLITAPFEIFLLIKFDLPIISELMQVSIRYDYILGLMKNRMMILGPFPLILLFSYFVIIYLSLFKPLQKNK